MRHVVTEMPAAALGVPPWECAAVLPRRTPPTECDVLIVGAGITGLASGMSIAESGRNVVVVDRAFGTGATSRSGGVVLGDTLVGLVSDFLDCDETLRKWIVDSGADCELFWCGCAELARDESLPPQPIDWRDGGPIRLAGRISGGVLNPLKLQYALANAARRAGVAIADGVAVVAIRRDGSRVAAVTDQGQIAAQHIVMAVDAIARTAEFDPWSERVITVALQTTPLSETALAHIGLMAHQSFHTRDLPLLWGRVMPDRSLLIGRETLEFSRGDVDVAAGFAIASARLTARVRRLHPELMDIEVRRSWGGPIARSAEGVPAIVAEPDHPRVLWVGGYGGHGVAQAFTMGRLVADRFR